MRGSGKIDPVASGQTFHPDKARRGLIGAALASPFLSLSRPAFGSTYAPRPYSTRVIESGHSLTDPIGSPLWAMVQAVGGAEAKRGTIDLDTVPGSPMQWRWDHRSEYPPEAYEDLPDYELLVITERVPVSATIKYHDSPGYALRWFNRALELGNGGKGADTILYASWVSTGSGQNVTADDPESGLSFRELLVPEMQRWQMIADYVNANRPSGSNPMAVIPGPLIMATVYDAIQAGTAPGLGAIADLFTDDIHLNDIGAYLISLAHFAVIYRRDPRIVPIRLDSVPVPRAETAEWMKELVANVLRDYADAGLEGIL